VRVAKDEAISRLASGIAHELNNHLTVIETGSGFVLKDVEPGSQVAQDVEEVREAGRRIGKLIRDLRMLDTSRRITGHEAAVSSCLDRVRGVAGTAVGPNIDVVVRPTDPDLRVCAGEDHVESALVILLAHAAASMPTGGQISISAHSASGPPVEPGTTPVEYVRIDVSDAGPGIAPEQLDTVFDPFSGPKLEGTAFGLATAYGIVRQLGGILEVTTAPGEGTTFHVRLPRALPLNEHNEG